MASTGAVAIAPGPKTPSRAGRVRVLTLVDFLASYGGAEHLAFQIAMRLDRERFESIMCITRWPMPPPLGEDPTTLALRDEIDEAGVGFLALGRRGKVDVRALGRLERFLRRERVDVVHAHKFGSNIWGVLAGRAAGVPVVLAHEHTWSFEGNPLRKLIDRELIARGADRLIAVSREDRRRMTEIERIDPRHTMFLPNGVPSRPPAGDRDLRAELGIAPDAPVVGLVGVLRPQKAISVLLNAVVKLRRETPGLCVLIVGGGVEQAELEALARELGVADVVRFLGPRRDIPDVLATFDVAVCCSDFEGSPLAVMEYMDAGLPTVASTVGGVPDLIEPGVHGLLVPPRDPDALAAAIAELLGAPERARAMGARARDRRRTEFDIDVLVGRLERLYLELLEAKRPVA